MNDLSKYEDKIAYSDDSECDIPQRRQSKNQFSDEYMANKYGDKFGIESDGSDSEDNKGSHTRYSHGKQFTKQEYNPGDGGQDENDVVSKKISQQSISSRTSGSSWEKGQSSEKTTNMTRKPSWANAKPLSVVQGDTNMKPNLNERVDSDEYGTRTEKKAILQSRKSDFDSEYEAPVSSNSGRAGSDYFDDDDDDIVSKPFRNGEKRRHDNRLVEGGSHWNDASDGNKEYSYNADANNDRFRLGGTGKSGGYYDAKEDEAESNSKHGASDITSSRILPLSEMAPSAHRRIPPSHISFVHLANLDPAEGKEHIQCTIIRDRSTIHSSMYPTYELILEENQKVLIVGKKMNLNRTSNYHLFDMTRGTAGSNLTKKSANYLGKLRATNSLRTHYIVVTASLEKEEIAGIAFERQGMYKHMSEGSQVLPQWPQF